MTAEGGEWVGLGASYLLAGRISDYRRANEEAIARTGDPTYSARSALMFFATVSGDYDGAIREGADVVDGAREMGVPYSLSYALTARGVARGERGDPIGGLDDLREAYRVATDAGIALQIDTVAGELGRAEVAHGSLRTGLDTLYGAIRRTDRTWFAGGLGNTLVYLAGALVSLGRLEPAAVLLGASEHIRMPFALVAAEVERTTSKLQHALGDACDALLAKGRTLDRGVAVAQALQAIDELLDR
jgi:hypothetical protein